MDQSRFDTIGSLFARHRLSRRQAVRQGTAGLAAVGIASAGFTTATAQDASPSADIPGTDLPAGDTEFLFVQSFESGSIAPTDGAEGTYTLTLSHGLGQTLYFSDRPERIVGAAPTQQFLDGLGFGPDNPPNAALVIGTADGGTDIAVVELTNPTYDAATTTATYDISVLANYETDTSLQLQQTPVDLATVAAEFGSAHLFIDDCDDGTVTCMRWNGNQGFVPDEGGRTLPTGYCFNYLHVRCEPCNGDALVQACFDQFPDFCDRNDPNRNCRFNW